MKLFLLIVFLAARFPPEYLGSVTRRKLIKDIVSSLFPDPVYQSVYHGDPGQDVLKRVKKMLVPPGVKTLFFKLHTATLPVKGRLVKKGIFVPWGSHCVLCKKPETVDHVFIGCWDAVFFWGVHQRTLKKNFPLHAHGIRFLSVEHDEMPLNTIMLLGLHGIWRKRMVVQHCNKYVRTIGEYFVESICKFQEVFKTAFR